MGFPRVQSTLLTLLAALAIAATASAQPSPIEKYNAIRDPEYAWKLVTTIPNATSRTYVLELTSQRWRSAKEVDRPVWKHWLSITKPSAPAHNKALLFIGAGNNQNPAPTAPSDRALKIAEETNSVVAELGMVPNQPLRFSDSPTEAREEDDIIAYSRVKHFTTKDDTWLVRLAMVKSGVRAMDAIQEFLASEPGGRFRIDHFVVAGASKRGWTTWLIGESDKRVVAIIPMVIDALNSQAITRHHFEAYGFFAPSLNDYVNHGLFPHKIGTPEYEAVLKIEDPYEHRTRPSLKLPKFLINASGDQFFLPDNSRFYYADLPEEKHLRYVPNTRHNLAESDALQSLTAFYQSILENKPRPRFTWNREPDGAITVHAKDKPTAVRLWQAVNPNARDFRLDIIGKAYQETLLQPDPRSGNVYTAKPSQPKKGFTAYFVELEFPGPGKYPLKFSTEVTISPDTLPFRFEDAARKYESSKPK